MPEYHTVWVLDGATPLRGFEELIPLNGYPKYDPKKDTYVIKHKVAKHKDSMYQGDYFKHVSGSLSDNFKDGEGLISSNGDYSARLYDDGNLCVHQRAYKENPSKLIWQSKKKDDKEYRGTNHFVMLYNDGNLCSDSGCSGLISSAYEKLTPLGDLEIEIFLMPPVVYVMSPILHLAPGCPDIIWYIGLS